MGTVIAHESIRDDMEKGVRKPIWLFRQIRTNQIRGFNQLPGGNSNSLSTLRISAWIVGRVPLTPGAVHGCSVAPCSASLALDTTRRLD